MSDPKRLLESSPHAFDRALLAAAGADAPSPDAEARALAALGLVTAGAAATVHGSTATKLLGALATKWLSIGLVATATTAGTVAYVVTTTEPQESAAPIATPAPTASAKPTPIPTPTPTPTPIPTPTPTPTPILTPTPIPTTPTPAPIPILTASPRAVSPEELSLIDHARAALRTGDGAAATRALDAYDARFPNGEMREEADVARIEALLATNDAAGAASRARAFLDAHPESAYARRVRALERRANSR